MNTFKVNQSIYYFSWINLILWIISGALFIILLAMRSPYWIFPLAGVIFLVQWLNTVSTYPRSVIINGDSIAFVMTSGGILLINSNEAEIGSTPSAYTFNFKQERVTRKIRIAKKNIPDELANILESLKK